MHLNATHFTNDAEGWRVVDNTGSEFPVTIQHMSGPITADKVLAKVTYGGRTFQHAGLTVAVALQRVNEQMVNAHLRVFFKAPWE